MSVQVNAETALALIKFPLPDIRNSERMGMGLSIAWTIVGWTDNRQKTDLSPRAASE